MNSKIEAITMKQIDSIISNYEEVKNDVTVKATPFAIPEGQKFTIQLIRGRGLSLQTYEDEEVSEKLWEWFQKARNHIEIQVMKNIDPILLNIPVERPVLALHCVWNESDSRVYFYLISISTSLYDIVYVKSNLVPSPLENHLLGLVDGSDYASVRIGEIISTLSENGKAHLKQQLESNSESLNSNSLQCQSVLWKLDFINCGDVDTHFVEYELED